MTNVNPRAGSAAPAELLVNVPRLVTAYYAEIPDPRIPAQRVVFGTSGHRGSALKRSFNEHHILAISQAICRYRQSESIDGPLFIGFDTHALAEPALVTAIEVFVANGVDVMIDEALDYTPTPVVSRAIIAYNAGRSRGLADGVVITPSHNPPEDGGFKYNPPHGGPAETRVTRWIEDCANALLNEGLREVLRVPYGAAMSGGRVHRYDFVSPYVDDLASVIDMAAIREARLRIGIDPMGGAAVHYWHRIAERYSLDLTLVNDKVDPTFGFMTLDWDGRIRMDCSSPYAMKRLVALKEHFDLAFGNDTDADRHGIVTASVGLMNPNHFLAAAIDYLYKNRPDWPPEAGIGKTAVSSAMIDRVASRLGRCLVEVPVGFKWFVEGLASGNLGFGGEESAGASFLRRDGKVWTTDKDGLIMGLLAAEMTAHTGRDPGEVYATLTRDFGAPIYERIDAPATAAQKRALGTIVPEQFKLKELGGEAVVSVTCKAPGNGQPLGGVKVVAQSGWFAARPSGTEDVYKLYAESFRGEDHLRRIQAEAQSFINAVFATASPD
jgi:phosphoglucomutase